MNLIVDALVYVFTDMQTHALKKREKLSSHVLKASVICTLIVFLIGCYGRKTTMSQMTDSNEISTEFSSEALHQDFDQLLNTIATISADPYSTMYRDSLTKMFHESTPEGNTFSKVEAYRNLAKHVALLGDGHTGVFAPAITDNVTLLPFILEESASGYRIKTDLTDQKRFTNKDIISINNRDIHEIIDEIALCISGELKEFRIHTACENFPQYLYSVSGLVGPYTLTVSDENKTSQEIIENGLSNSVLTKRIIDYYACEPYEMMFVDSLNLALMTLHTMRLYREFDRFLRKSMKDLNNRDIERMAIDIRDNPGGTDEVFMKLLDKISTTPYCHYDSVYARKTDSVSNTDSIYIQTCNRRTEPKGENAFDGEIYILINEGTFSSASSLAWIAQRYGIATLIGRASGSPCTRSAAIRYFTLENTHLKYMVPTKKIVRQGCPENRLVPDITVPISSESGNDIFDYFIKYLSNQNNDNTSAQ